MPGHTVKVPSVAEGLTQPGFNFQPLGQLLRLVMRIVYGDLLGLADELLLNGAKNRDRAGLLRILSFGSGRQKQP